MQLSITKESLMPPLAVVLGAADTRPHGDVPILNHALLKTSQGKLSLLCGDGCVVARTLVNCEVAEDGELAVDARRLSDLIRAIPDKQAISFGTEKDQLLVKAGRSRFRLPVRPASDYPKMVTSDKGMVTLQIAAHRLGDMLEQVSLSMASCDVRAYLNGALFSIEQGALWCVGTDGHRMTVAQQPIEGSEGIAATSVIIPRKSVLLARKLLGGCGDASATVVFGNNEFRLHFADQTVVVTKCIEGRFPDWRRILPKSPNVAHLDSAKLTGALGMIRAAMDSSGKRGSSVRAVALTMAKGSIALKHGDVASSEVEAKNPDGSNEEIGIVIDYLIDALDTLPKDAQVRVGYEGPMQAVALRAEAAEYPLTVVMPVRL